jgi:uncharacterized protein
VKRIAALTFIAGILLAAGQVPAAAQTAPQASDLPVVVTTGEGVIKRAPDRAWVTIAAESRGKTPAEVQKLNADAMTAVMAKLKSAGLSGDAIRTSAYELRPEFDYANNRQTLRGYVVRNAVEVRVDDLAKLGDILDTSVGAGATSVSGIRFDLKDRAGAEQTALQQAAGMKVDRVMRIDVNRQSAMPPPRPMVAMRAEMAQSAETPIAPGELEVRATVTMTVVIK